MLLDSCDEVSTLLAHHSMAQVRSLFSFSSEKTMRATTLTPPKCFVGDSILLLHRGTTSSHPLPQRAKQRHVGEINIDSAMHSDSGRYEESYDRYSAIFF
jgi:hypothetical protein